MNSEVLTSPDLSPLKAINYDIRGGGIIRGGGGDISEGEVKKKVGVLLNNTVNITYIVHVAVNL